jgi:hypothetical protein
MHLLVRNYDVYVVDAAQTVVSNREEAVSVRGQIDSHHVRAFVRDHVEKSGVLMREAVTRSPAFAGAFRNALNVVMPAHRSGAAPGDESSSGIDTSPLAFAIITSAYPPS